MLVQLVLLQPCPCAAVVSCRQWSMRKAADLNLLRVRPYKCDTAVHRYGRVTYQLEPRAGRWYLPG